MGVKLFLDMDEVFCDFVGGAVQEYGVSKEEMWNNQRMGEWSILPALTRVLGEEITQYDFEKRIKSKGSKFWKNLKPLPWFQSLLELVESLKVEWYILSAPANNTECYNGKIQWLHENFGHSFNRFLITEHKHLLAGKKCFLVDDKPQNVLDFRQHGGAGITFPSGGNSLYVLRHDPLKWLSPVLKKRIQDAHNS